MKIDLIDSPYTEKHLMNYLNTEKRESQDLN